MSQECTGAASSPARRLLRPPPTMNFRLASNATRSALAARFVGPTKALQRPQAASASARRAAPDEHYGTRFLAFMASEHDTSSHSALVPRAWSTRHCRARRALLRRRVEDSFEQNRLSKTGAGTRLELREQKPLELSHEPTFSSTTFQYNMRSFDQNLKLAFAKELR